MIDSVSDCYAMLQAEWREEAEESANETLEKVSAALAKRFFPFRIISHVDSTPLTTGFRGNSCRINFASGSPIIRQS
jgi:hypothetical protein